MTYKHESLDKYIDQLKDCLQHEVSFCSAACPLKLDVNAFISRLQEGRFNAAYKLYRDAAGFPFIAAEICNSPCKDACIHNAVGQITSGEKSADPIQLNQLEKAAISYVKRKDPTDYNLPAKPKSVAVIGAGISGMAFALRMATKRYKVHVYEKTDRTGGSLNDVIDPQLIQDDFQLQMQFLEYEVKYNTEVTSLEAMAGDYDAIYVATGLGGNRFGIPEDGPQCMLIGDTGIFLGGSMLGLDYIHALGDGLRMATAIDNFTMTKNLKYPEWSKSDIAIDEAAMVRTEKVQMTEGELFTKEEAVEEAKRCMKCQCSACRLHCDLTDYVQKWPLRLKDEILATTALGKSELHATPAVRLINTCTHCGLCKDTCPSDIDMDGLIQAARIKMHKLDKMPWAFNDFFLRDMAFSNGESAYICRNPEDNAKAEYAFFPGCQLGSSAPELVMKSYEYLLSHKPDTGIMLGCCGVPAMWAGDEELHDGEIDRIRRDWETLGQPKLILACPSCSNNFSKYLPEIETISLYELMAQWGLEGFAKASDSAVKLDGGCCVFDPCATKEGDPVRDAVRSLCGEMGLNLQPLPIQEKWSACCSFGGNGAIADGEFAKFVRKKRIEESDLPYITYCINCRDSFMTEGKEAVHLLNLIFGVEPHLDTITKRRENRIALKEQLMKKIWNEATEVEEKAEVRLEMDESVRQKLSDEYILEDEAANVVAFLERTERTLYNTEADSFSGYRKIGNMTYWVEYRRTDEPDKFLLLNAYSHRMEIELEMVWNGEKISIDM